ncbi:alpha/beta hydrolase [Synechococcus sp. CCY 9618]|uniref:alpha/beta hydrolase n=1 Tax=Synechococcus sp. CCY 9618 TaxID=2815602 RepID=UPI001C23FBDF|nr:alpha/beta hydrolase [Synechococcus sp. CCY 9618]
MRAVLVRSALAPLLLATLISCGTTPALGSLGQDLAYGQDRLQRLSFWGAASEAGRPAPLILFVHGGGWKRGDRATATGRAKVSHFRARGYAFATMNYRLVPAATVEQQAADVASALAWLIRHAGRLGIDPRRIVLMGHSAGAHLVALVGTDPAYLRSVGLTQGAVAGVVPIDGAAYDVPAQLRLAGPLMQQTYAQAFGNDPLRQRALSPTWQAAAPNAPAFLLLHVQRLDARSQTRDLARALQRAGTPVEVAGFAGTGLAGHMAINRQLGQPDDPATRVVDGWLRSLFLR